MMNQQQAGNVLKRNAPRGEHPAYINNQEANWLKGMGGSGKRTKSGLRSYAQENNEDFDDQSSEIGGEVNNPNDQSGASQIGNPDANLGAEVGSGPDMFTADNSGTFSDNMSWQGAVNSFADATQTRGSDGKMYYNKSHPNTPINQITEGGANVANQAKNFLSGVGGGSNTRNNTSSSISEIDKPSHEFRKKIYDKAGNVMDQEYESYGDATDNQRFADVSSDTTNAQEAIRNAQGTGKTDFAQAGQVGKNVSGYNAEQVQGGDFTQGHMVDEYMNPHTANVINANTNQAMKAMQMGRNQLGAQGTMAGADLGSRSAIEKGVMSSEVLNNLNQQNYNAMNDSFANAQVQKRQDMMMNQDAQKYNQTAGLNAQGVRLKGAQQQIAGANAGRTAGYQDAQMLSQVGADGEARDQREKDFAYDEYLEGRDWDKNNTMFASNVLSGAPIGTNTTQNNPQYRNQKVDRFGRIISGAASGWLMGGPTGALVGGGIGAIS